MAYKVKVTLSRGNSERRVARDKGTGEVGHLDPAEAKCAEEGGDRGGAESAVPLGHEHGVVDIADG